MAESTLTFVPVFLAVLVIAASGQTGTNCEDVHLITFVNSNTENAVDIYVTSGSSTSFEQDKLDGQQLSERCAYSPDCAKLLNSEQSRGSDATQSVITLPLQNGIALLDYRCSNDVLTRMATGTFDTGCSATTVFTTDNGGGPYFVCLTTDEIFVYEVAIDYDSVEDSNLIEVMTIPGVNTSAASLSNFLYTFEENFDLIVYGSGNNIATVQLPIGTFQQAGVLTNCSKVERLERVRGPNPSTWARCNDGTTKSFDVQMLGDSIRTVTSSELFRFICPDSNIFMEIDLDNSFIKYGLEDTFQTFSLPGSKFRPDLSICFEVNNVILLAFVDEEEGVYVFDSSVFTVTKLFELQACPSEPSLCRQLLLFCDRYLHVREPDGNSLIDMQSLEVIIDHQFIPVEFAAIITCPSESPSSDSNDDYMAYIIVGASVTALLLVLIPLILVLVACTVYNRCYRRLRRPVQETQKPQQETVDIPLSDVNPNGAEGEGASGSAKICDSTEDSADSTGLTAQPHRRGHMDVLGNAAGNRPLTIGQTSMDTEQGSLPSLPPSGDKGQGSGWPQPIETETTFIQAAGDAQISNEIHSQHQDYSQTQTYDASPSHSGQLDSQRIVISLQTVQPEVSPPVASRADPEGGDGIIPLTDNSPRQVLVLGMMSSSMSRRTSEQHAQEQYQDRPQTPESANHTHLEPPPPDSMHRSQRSSNASSTAELLPQNRPQSHGTGTQASALVTGSPHRLTTNYHPDSLETGEATVCEIPDCRCQEDLRRAYNSEISGYDTTCEGQHEHRSDSTSMSEFDGVNHEQRQQPDILHPLLSSLLNILSVLQCTSSGTEFHSDKHDVHIKIPPGAIPPGETLTIEVGIALYGPYNFPEDMVPVSPIVWLCVTSPSQQNYRFLKPVEIRLPHCLDPPSESNSLRQLRFLKANHDTAGNKNGYYNLLLTDGRAAFSQDTPHGTLYTDHFCSVCIASGVTEERAAANFCLVMATPLQPLDPRDIYFGVMFLLPTCIETFKMRLPGYEFFPKEFKFSSFKNKVEIKFDECVEGWQLVQMTKSSEDISMEKIEFSKNPEILKMKEELDLYPPRFTIRIFGSDAVKTCRVVFTFFGANEVLQFRYLLQCPRSGVSASRSMPDISHPMRSLLPGDEGYLNKQCTEKHLTELSRHIHDWENIVGFLGFQNTMVIVSDIKTRYPRDQRLQTKQMFLEWRVCHGQAATYSYLIGVFEKLQKMAYVDKLREMVSQSLDEDCFPMISHRKRPRNDD